MEKQDVLDEKANEFYQLGLEFAMDDLTEDMAKLNDDVERYWFNVGFNKGKELEEQRRNNINMEVPAEEEHRSFGR